MGSFGHCSAWVHQYVTVRHTTLKHCWRPCTCFDGSNILLFWPFQQDYLPWYKEGGGMVKEWFKDNNNNAFVVLTWPSNSPYLYLIKPLWDVLDNQSDPWRPQIPKPTLMGLATPANGDQHFLLFESSFSLFLLFYSPSSCLSFSSFIWLKTRGPYVIKNPANKKRLFWWEKKGIEEERAT